MGSASFRTRLRGFSLIEILVVVGVISIMATIAIVTAGKLVDAAQEEKLQSDVASLNSAIDVYLANGGSLDGLTTPASVVAKLKSTRSQADGKRHTGGPSGRMIDPRIITVPVDAGSRKLRAFYNAADKRFEIAGSGGGGVEFDLADHLNEMSIPTENRDHDVYAYAKDSNWVWDYKALSNPENPPGSTPVKTVDEPGDSLPPGVGGGGGPGGGGGGGSPPEEEEIPELARPTFSPPGGKFAYDDFPIAVTIGGSPDPAAGKTIFQVDGGAWQDYSGQVVQAVIDTQIQAQNISFDQAAFLDSSVAYAKYRKKSAPRLPTPKFSQPGGDYSFENFPIQVALTNVPDPAIADPMYRLKASGESWGTWQPYLGTVSVPINTSLGARYFTVDDNYYRDSYERSGYYYPIATDLGGNVVGAFKDPEGGPTLLYEITEGGTFFSHGNPQLDLGGEIIDAGEPNTLKWAPGSFSGIEEGESFKLGDLFYHNGTTFNDSHADGVKLQISITLTDPAEIITFDIDFDLINTANSDDADASADYVRLTNLTQDINLNIHGVDYSIELEFGGTDSFGFSTDNEFHVYEGATGKGEINATFVADP